MTIFAVLVTHKPDLDRLERNLAALVPQVAGVVLVDDGSDPKTQQQLIALAGRISAPPGGVHPLMLGDNCGIARAQNAGLGAARARGAQTVLLMDQDSLAAPAMVAALADGLQQAANPAVIGVFYDEPHRGEGLKDPKGAAGGAAGGVAGDLVEWPSVIASGSLIPLAVFDRVGPFDADLFIDFVDHDWCFRARAAGLRCYTARRARMQHQIGDVAVALAGRARAVHSPDRMYYQIRNLLLLVRKPATPRRWFWGQLPRFLARSLVLGLAVPPRRARLGAVAQGLWHGLRGRTGRRRGS